jgi:hypothetical protein
MVEVTICEKVFKLERDEAAMIQRITNTNMKAVGVEQFIYNQMGGLADLQNRGENEKNIRLDMFADKKKIFQSERIVGKETFVVNLEEIFAH